MSNSIITSGIDVGSNEYLTKFSLNRNFEKLLDNDQFLKDQLVVNDLDFETYNPNKLYDFGDIVFFKTELSSLNLYLLKCTLELNVNHPICKIDRSGTEIVVDGNGWNIVGLTDQCGGLSAIDIAKEYVLSSKNDFRLEHELNTDLSAHPLGEFNLTNSKVLFSDFSNINEDRDTFFYPYKILKLTEDDVIRGGYLRKWDNGILEYDITFRLGYTGVDEYNTTIISANSLLVPRRNYNYLYFKNKSDYSIFSLGGEYNVVLDDKKTVNLNLSINSYSGTINFPIKFSNLDYMVFTSNVKNMTTRAYNTFNNAIVDHDSRLEIKGTTIVGHLIDDTKEDNHILYRSTVIIPDKVKTIADSSMQEIKAGKESDDYPLQIKFDISENSQLVNIGDEAFMDTNIYWIDITKNVRRIGKNAFDSCSKLTSIDFYVYPDPAKLPKIEENAFNNTPLKVVNIHYVQQSTLLGATNDMSEEEKRQNRYSDTLIVDKFRDPLIRSYLFGIDNSDLEINEIDSYIKDQYYLELTATIDSSTLYNAEIQQEYLTFSTLSSVDDDLADKKTPLLTSSLKKSFIQFDISSISLASIKDSFLFATADNDSNDDSLTSFLILDQYFNIDANVDGTSSITGYKDSLPEDYVLDFTSEDLNDGTLSNLRTIGGLDSCSKLKKVVLSYPIELILSIAFSNCTSLTSITISSGVSSIGSEAFSNCLGVAEAFLSCPATDGTKYFYLPTTFDGTTFRRVNLLANPQLYGSFNQTNGYLRISSDVLVADLSSGFMCKYALANSIVDKIILHNILSGLEKEVGTYTIKTFDDKAFSNCSAESIVLGNEIYSSVKSFFTDTDETDETDESNSSNSNRLGILSSATILSEVTQRVEAIITPDGYSIEEVPEYLNVDGLSVKNIDFSKFEDGKCYLVLIPKSITSISAEAFSASSKEWANNFISSIVFLERIQYIGDNAFSDNKQLEDITFPKDVDIHYLGISSIAGCSKLSSFAVKKSMEEHL